MEELHPEPGEAPEPAETDGGGSAGAGARASSKLETRAALIRAALSEFGERGFDAPSLDAICARAGYTRGAFYVHFRSRDELVSAAMEWVLGALLDAVIGPDATSADLSQTIDLYVGLSTRGRSRLDEEVDDDENGGELAGMPLHQVLEACERAPAVRERLRRMLGDAMRRLTTVVESERKRQGVREDVEASEISSLLLLLALGLRVATDLELPIDVASGRDALGRLLDP